MYHEPSLTKVTRAGRTATVTRDDRAWTVAVEGEIIARRVRVQELDEPIPVGRRKADTLTHAVGALGLTTQEADALRGAAAYIDARTADPWRPGEIRYSHSKRLGWRLKARAGDLQPGEVTVTKKDGTTSVVVVTEVGEPFGEGGETFVLAQFARREHHECQQCENAPGAVQRYDSSGIRGWVCRKCNTMRDYELSFA